MQKRFLAVAAFLLIGCSVTLRAQTTIQKQTAISDGTTPTQKASVSAGGALKVDNSAVTQPVSGTVTANQSGNWTMRLAGNGGAILDFAGQNASAPANSVLIGGEFNTSPTTISSGNASPLQLDSSGDLLINLKTAIPTGGNTIGAVTQASGPWTSNETQLGGTAIDTNSGNKSAGTQRMVLATDQPALTNALKVDPSGVTSPVSGTVTANQGGNWTMRLQGNAGAILDAAGQNASSPANEILIGGQFNTSPTTITSGNMSPLQLDSAGDLLTKINAALPTGGNTIGAVTQASGPWTSNETQLGGTAIDTNSGNKSAGTQRMVLATDQPALTNALKVDPSGVTSPVSGSGNFNVIGTKTNNNAAPGATNVGVLPAIANASAPTFTEGDQVLLSTDLAGNVRVTGSLSVGGTTDNSAYTAGSSTGTPAYGFYHSTIDTVTDGRAAALAIDSKRNLFNVIRDAAGNARGVNVTSGNALVVDNSAVTQPVSGTVTANQGGNWTMRLQGNGGAILDFAGQNASAPANSILIGGEFNTSPTTISSGNASPLQLDSAGDLLTKINAALPTGGNTIGAVTQASGPWTSNETQLGGTAIDTNSGNKSAGTQRMVLATDQPALTNALKVDPSAVTSPVNVAQVNGSTVSTAATGTQKVGVVGNGGATVDAAVGGASAPTNAIAAAGIYNNATPVAPTDGQAAAIQIDQAGNQRVFWGVAQKTLSAQGTAQNSTQNILTNSGAEAVMVQLTQTTTLTAGAITYEVSYDGSNWSTIPANDVLDPTSTTFAQIPIPYTVQASTNKQFLILMNGAQGLRIKTSTAITGTGSVTPNYQLLAFNPFKQAVVFSPTASNFNVTVGAALPTGANTIGNVAQNGTWTVQPGNTANTTPWLVTQSPATSGGLSFYSGSVGATVTSVKSSAGQLYGWYIYNSNTSAVYVQLFNKATGSVTLGTTGPDMALGIPATSGANVEFNNGIVYGTAISFACTTTRTGSTAPTNTVDVNFLYK